MLSRSGSKEQGENLKNSRADPQIAQICTDSCGLVPPCLAFDVLTFRPPSWTFALLRAASCLGPTPPDRSFRANQRSPRVLL